MSISKEIETSLVEEIMEKLSQDALGVDYDAGSTESLSRVSFTPEDLQKLWEQIDRMSPKCYANKNQLELLKREFRSQDIYGFKLIGVNSMPENMALWVMPDGSTTILNLGPLPAT